MKKFITLIMICFTLNALAQDDSVEQPYVDESMTEHQAQPEIERSPDSEEPHAYPDAETDSRQEEPQYQEPVEPSYEEQY